MCEKDDEKDEDDSADMGKSATENKETGFGDAKKAIDKDTIARREKQLKEGKEQFDRGERKAVPLADYVETQRGAGAGADGDVVAKDKQRQGEAKTYSWWSVERCQKKNVPDVSTACVGDGSQADKDDPAREIVGDIALTEPSSVDELVKELKFFNVDVSKFGKGSAKTVEGLYHELETMECRLMLRGKQLIRVVDLVVLRIKTPSGKILVEQSQKFPDGRDRACNRLPAKMRQAGASGIEIAKSEISKLLANELGTSTDVIKVDIKLDDPTQETSSYLQTSQSYPGLEAVYRKTFFEATVNEKADASKLKKLGLMGETAFTTNMQDGTISTWQWYTPDDIKKNDVNASAPIKVLSEFENFTPLKEASWTEATITKQLNKHKIDTAKFGTGKARSIKDLAQETGTGETRLYSNGKEMRRYLDILVVKIKNNDAYLVETGHSFGSGQSKEKMQLPATKVRPFEDKVWAVRRLLGEVDIPYASSKIMFGPRRIETQESPSYPGITTVYLKQVVEVTLSEIDVMNLIGDDMGVAKWFAHTKVR
jgi:hypothetical protein